MLQAAELGWDIVAHVHDEMIIDAPLSDPRAADKVTVLMSAPIPWAPGLPLKAGTYECNYYKKD
jgi:DNA polymerase